MLALLVKGNTGTSLSLVSSFFIFVCLRRRNINPFWIAFPVVHLSFYLLAKIRTNDHCCRSYRFVLCTVKNLMWTAQCAHGKIQTGFRTQETVLVRGFWPWYSINFMRELFAGGWSRGGETLFCRSRGLGRWRSVHVSSEDWIKSPVKLMQLDELLRGVKKKHLDVWRYTGSVEHRCLL
jgi:hypothetical protein